MRSGNIHHLTASPCMVSQKLVKPKHDSESPEDRASDLARYTIENIGTGFWKAFP